MPGLGRQGGLVTYWVKISYERDTYVIDLKQISAFCRAPNRKVTFWLPDGRIPILIHPQSNQDAYEKVVNYIKQIVTTPEQGAYWVKILYDREEYAINLARISAFSREPNTGKISFWLPDSGTRIIIHPHSNPDAYSLVMEYIEKKTGYSLE